jgi:hypothetical protein
MDWKTDTIVWGSFEANRSIAASAMPRPAAAELPIRTDSAPGRFRIRAADTARRRSSASILIKRRYAWRGYEVGALPDQQTAQRVTLTAVDKDVTIGTITVNLDGHEGLNADDEFGDEVDALRVAGRRICEFTKLAVDSSVHSKRVLASLFHVAYIYAHRIQSADVLVMEVNPRHVRYYQQMLGCHVLGEERLNRRVNAPAVLLSVEFSHIREQINKFAGRSGQPVMDRTLYPHGFSADEEIRIIERLLRTEWLGCDTAYVNTRSRYSMATS